MIVNYWHNKMVKISIGLSSILMGVELLHCFDECLSFMNDKMIRELIGLIII